jgi:GH35 family endo-1,4-beta-xylanase
MTNHRKPIHELAFTLVFFVTAFAHSSDAWPLGPILGSSPDTALTLAGTAWSTGGLVPVSDGYFVRANEVRTLRQPPAVASVQLFAPNQSAVQQNDLLALQFYSRTIASADPGGKARANLVFETVGAGTTRSLDAALAADPQWKHFTYVFRAARAYSPGQARFAFQLGFLPQTIQFTDLRLSDIGAPVAIEAPPLRNYRVFGDAARTTVSVVGQPFTQALRITTRSRPANPWNAQLYPTPQVYPTTVTANDVFYLVFRARSISSIDPSGRAMITPIVEHAVDYRKSLEASIRLDGEWREYRLPFKAGFAYAAGEMRFACFIGYAPQVFEIGDIQIMSFRQTISVNDLPRDINATYAGREPDAPWRAQAADRIRQHRKAELEIEVRDADSLPVPYASVHANLTRHAFGFGSAVNLQRLTDPSPTYATYRQKILELFNRVVNENDLKWPAWEGDWGAGFTKAKSIAGLQWLKARGYYVRGHNLVWPSYDNVANSARALWGQPDALRAHVLWHIGDVGTSTGMYCDEFDVINEPYTNHDLMDMLGNDVMVDWFNKAREVMPATRLFLNDYDILASGGSTDTAHQQGYYDAIRFLLDRGAPLGGIGCQGHFNGSALTPPPTLWQILDRFSTFGLPIEITEFDLGTFDDLADADYMRDFMTAVFAHPSVSGFVQWGFWERMHWQPERALFRADWSIKPNGVAYKQLVFRDWWTTAAGATDDSGRYRVADKAFKGRYDITASLAGASVTTSNVELIADRIGSNRIVLRLAGLRATPEAVDDRQYSITAATLRGLRSGAPGVLANDRALGPLTARLESGPAHATSFTLNADGSFFYMPQSAYRGVDTFRYRAAFGNLLSAPATVSITVLPPVPSSVKRWPLNR